MNVLIAGDALGWPARRPHRARWPPCLARSPPAWSPYTSATLPHAATALSPATEPGLTAGRPRMAFLSAPAGDHKFADTCNPDGAAGVPRRQPWWAAQDFGVRDARGLRLMSTATSATCTAGRLDCGASDSTARARAPSPSALARSEGHYLLTTHPAAKLTQRADSRTPQRRIPLARPCRSGGRSRPRDYSRLEDPAQRQLGSRRGRSGGASTVCGASDRPSSPPTRVDHG